MNTAANREHPRGRFAIACALCSGGELLLESLVIPRLRLPQRRRRQVNPLRELCTMAEFPEIRRRLARFRRNLEAVLVAEACVFGLATLAAWLFTGDALWLLLALVAIIAPLIGIWAFRRDLRPEEDLRGTVQVLNRKKKFYRKHLGIRFRFSRRWFPFGEFVSVGHRNHSPPTPRPEGQSPSRPPH